MRTAVALVSALVFSGTLAVSGDARASEIFPANIKRYWGLPDNSNFPVPGQKGCQLCHTDDSGGPGTVTQPFGKTMQAHGLNSGDVQSLIGALGYVSTHYTAPDSVDSDGDGVADVIEVVVDHTNPNDPKSLKTPMVTPPIPSGGDGGGSAGNEGGEGGQARVEQLPPPPPAFTLPSTANLPPAFVHGCALAPGASEKSMSLALLLLGAAAFVRRARLRGARAAERSS